MGIKLSITEILKLMAIRAKKSIAGLSKELGFNNRAALNSMVLRGKMPIDLIQTYANKCGYKVVFVPVDQEVENAIDVEGRKIE